VWLICVCSCLQVIAEGINDNGGVGEKEDE
jgi:hypothetical protein